ncbi:MAG: hypothetical protein KIT09_13800 [Bryobacteraceae bacterium]|nr:hypothetical protein [Bryobacteraceae bacterium]
MRMPIFIMSVALAAGLATAQEQSPQAKPEPKAENLEATIIPVKTLSGDSFRRLANLLGVFGARYAYDDKLRTIVVYAPKDVVAQMRRVVEELDRPGSEAAIGRNIEMTLSFLRCSTKEPQMPAALPPDLEPVARQLRAVTQCKDVQLWDTVPLRLQEGKNTEQESRLPSTISDVPSAVATVQLGIQPEAVIRKESGTYVRFERLRINFRLPYSTAPKQSQEGASPLVSTQFQVMNVGLTTSGDFKEGQKSVLGKISGLDDDTSIFVAISLKVLD